MMSTRTFKDGAVDNISARLSLATPVLPITTNPVGVAGCIAYDSISATMWFRDDVQWLPMSSAGALSAFSLYKDGDQTIASGAETTLTNWGVSPPFIPTGGWNYTTGVFTASNSATLNMRLGVTWNSGESNVGKRTTRIKYYNTFNNTTSTICESTFQPNPDTTIASFQMTGVALALSAGDQAWITVEQNSGSPLTVIGDGKSTLASGTISLAAV